MPILLAALFFLITAVLMPPPPMHIDLNSPEDMAYLQRFQPAQHKKVREIVARLARQEGEDAARWIQTDFHARGVSYPNVLLTSCPPQRDLSFELEGTHYHGRVTLQDDGGRIYPTRHP